MVERPEEPWSVRDDVGVCAMCHQRPAEYLELICDRCKEAIDNNEEWVVDYPDILFQLAELEGEEEEQAS